MCCSSLLLNVLIDLGHGNLAAFGKAEMCHSGAQKDKVLKTPYPGF